MKLPEVKKNSIRQLFKKPPPSIATILSKANNDLKTRIQKSLSPESNEDKIKAVHQTEINHENINPPTQPSTLQLTQNIAESYESSPQSTPTPPSTNPSHSKETVDFIDSILNTITENVKKNISAQTVNIQPPANSVQQSVSPQAPVQNIPPQQLLSQKIPAPLQAPVSPLQGSQAQNALPSQQIPQQVDEHGMMHLSKNQRKKLKKKMKQAKQASIQHKDTAKDSSDLDFDALLDIHEKRSAKISQNKSNAPSKSQNVPSKRTHVEHVHESYSQSSISKRKYTEDDHVPKNITDVAYEILGKPRIPPQVSNTDPRPTKKQKQKENTQPNESQQKTFVPRVECVYFTRGFCKQGDQCTFAHTQQETVSPRPSATSNIVCQFYKTLSCVKGDECPFSHDLKLEPCRFFHMDGVCKNNNCPYSHDPLNQDTLARLRVLTGPCRFYYFKGYCDTGEACKFSHDDCQTTQEDRDKVALEILPCKFFHVYKNCKKGDLCFYSHEESTPEQIEALCKQEGL